MSDAMKDTYDAGLLNDWGGGNVEWWQDYIRAELERSHDFYAARVAELEAELASAERQDFFDLQEKLSAAEAREAKLREALEHYCAPTPAGDIARTALQETQP